MLVRGTALVVCALLLAGCGSSGGAAAAKPCVSPGAARALKRLAADTAAIRAAARLPTKNVLDGNAAVSRATDRFLLDVETAPLDNLTRNRLIDHAAAALVGSCEQCFQALEAERPIVTIAHKGDCPK
ncbi:MAG TPA: hypothetical protein VLW05_02390 [Gaiellaceae bacterium]|nr:hypothetical protein [Gaiellaceae bacterium]